jgi:hypothetical protein
VDEAVPVSDAQPGAGWPEAIVVPSWRWRVWLNPGTWLISVAAFVALLLVTAVAVGATYFALALVDDSALSGAAEFAVRAAAVGASVALTWLVILEVMRRAARATASSFVGHIPESDPARAFMLAEIAEHGPPRDSWGAWHVRRWLERVRAGRPARAFVSAHLAERTSRYERTDRPVEPEEVGGGIGRGDAGSIALFGFLGAVTGWAVGWTSMFTLACGAIVAMTLFRRFRRRSMFSPVVAGQGWVQHGNVRWTVEDSVLVATGWANARVCVVGPPGVLVMRLRTARHRDLECLWVRWMHPEPRLGQEAFGE